MSAVVKVKVLKPQTLKQKEMRLELLNALRSAARAVQKDYEATVATWNRKPKFELVIALGKTKAEFLVGTDDKIYGYVDEGTKPHTIVPKKAKVLRFSNVYRAKTSPGVIGSSDGGSSGDPVFTQVVKHPGIRARKFSKTINAKHKKSFKDKMHEAMRRAREKSGNSI